MARARGYVGDRVAACSHHGLLLRVGGARASEALARGGQPGE